MNRGPDSCCNNAAVPMYDRTWYVTPFSAKASRCGESPRKVSSWGKSFARVTQSAPPNFSRPFIAEKANDLRNGAAPSKESRRRHNLRNCDYYHLYIKFSSARIILPLSFVTCCNTFRTVLLRKGTRTRRGILSPFLGVPPLSPLFFPFNISFPFEVPL